VSQRTYRLSPPDRTGWFLGLGGPQVITLGVALVGGVILVNFGMPVALAGLGVVAAGVLSLARLAGRPLIEWVPTLWRWLRRGRRGARWLAPLTPAGAVVDTPPLPPPLDGHVLRSAPCWTGTDAAVVHDTEAATYAATVGVSGRQFALVERGEQDGLLALWGEALAAFCREGSPVSEVRWSEWAAPAGMEEQHTYLEEHAIGDPLDPAVVAYRELLRTVAPVVTRHEVLVTVVIASAKVRVGVRHRGDPAAAAAEVLLEELRQLTRRLEAAGPR
jgi:hypothetical protein